MKKNAHHSPATLATLAGAMLLALASQAAAAAERDADKPRPVVDFSSCAKPAWPKADLAARHSGTVTLSYSIDSLGKADAGTIVKSSGHAGLDEAARSGIAKCSFKNGPGAVQLQYVWVTE